MERRPLVVERVDEAKADETGKAARRVEQYLEARRVVIQWPLRLPRCDSCVQNLRLPCFDPPAASIPLSETTHRLSPETCEELPVSALSSGLEWRRSDFQ